MWYTVSNSEYRYIADSVEPSKPKYTSALCFLSGPQVSSSNHAHVVHDVKPFARSAGLMTQIPVPVSNHFSPCGAYLTLVSPPQVRSVSLGPESVATAEWTGSVFQINPAPAAPFSYQLCRAPQTSRLRTKILVVRIRQGYELLKQTPLSSVGRTCNARLRSWGSLSPNP